MTGREQALSAVVRISNGRVDPTRTDEVIAALEASEATLRPAISALPRLVSYYVGVDRDTSTITNTSIWHTKEHAMAMNSLQEMAALRADFEQLGVVFDPIANYTVLWEM